MSCNSFRDPVRSARFEPLAYANNPGQTARASVNYMVVRPMPCPSVRSHDLIPRSAERGGRSCRAFGVPPSLAPPSVHSRPPNEVTLTRMTEALDLGLTDDRGGGGGEGGGRYVYFASHARLRRRGQLYYLSSQPAASQRGKKCRIHSSAEKVQELERLQLCQGEE